MAKNDAEIIISAELDTGDAEKGIERLVRELSEKRIDLMINADSLKSVQTSYLNALDNVNAAGSGASKTMIDNLNKLKGEYEELIAKNIQLRGHISNLNSEISRINGSNIKRISDDMKVIPLQADLVNKSISGIRESINNASIGITNFNRRIFNLIRNAFIFRFISHGFRSISSVLATLINRDLRFSESLIIVRANLIRAFAPIFQAVLPWIRSLGNALVWISQQIIRFINWLTGSNIQIVRTAQEGRKVVDNFMKIVSPKREMFDFEKPRKNSDKILNNLKKSKDESKGILASFDKLETLKFAEDDAERLKGENRGLDIGISSNIDDQIAMAINNIEDKPLDFTVNDNLSDQIRKQVNGINLPVLDFKVNGMDIEKIKDFTDRLWILRDAIVGIGIALIVYKVIKGITDFFTLLTPGGWVTIGIGAIAGLLALVAIHFDDIKRFCSEAGDKIKDFASWIKYSFFNLLDRLLDKIRPIIDAFKNIGSGIGGFFSGIGNLFGGGSRVAINAPRLAQGGVLRGGDPFLAYVNDQPRGQTNIETPLSTMVEAFKQAIDETSYGQNQMVTITADGDMLEFLRMFDIKLSKEKMRSGNYFLNEF